MVRSRFGPRRHVPARSDPERRVPRPLKRFSPSAERNRHDILAVLGRFLPERGTVLEIGSGTGQHAVHFARHLAGLTWQPSETDAEGLASIEAHRIEADLANLLPSVALDATEETWPLETCQAVVAINVLHISPWAVAEGIATGAARVLAPGGTLFLYGAYKRDGAFTTPSNEAFDRSLRQRDPAWGVRDLEAVTDLAARCGLDREAVVDTPINNFSLVFRRTRAQSPSL